MASQVNLIEDLAVKEAAIQHQTINGAGYLHIFFGLFQHRQNMQIFGFFNGINFDSQGYTRLDFIGEVR